MTTSVAALRCASIALVILAPLAVVVTLRATPKKGNNS